MNSFGQALLALVLITVPAVGAGAGEYDEQIASIAEHRGFSFTPAEMHAAKVAEVSFTLPAGVDSFTAAMDWATKEIVVSPGAAPDNSGESGCRVVAGYGWAQSPISATIGSPGNPGCVYEAHPGGVHNQLLFCFSGTYCSIDALNLGNFFDSVLLYCQYAGVALATMDWDTNTLTVYAGECFAYNFGFFANAPDYAAYDSIVQGDGAGNLGLNNWLP